MAVVKEIPTSSKIPQFTPLGELWYAQDTGDLWIGTGFSTGSDFTAGNPGPNVNIELISSPGGSPGGFSGDIQFNNAGVLGGSAATITAAGTINIPAGQKYEINGVPLSSSWAGLTGDLTETQVIPWDGGTVGTPDSGISRIGAGSLAIGNGTAGDFTGSLTVGQGTGSGSTVTRTALGLGSAINGFISHGTTTDAAIVTVVNGYEALRTDYSFGTTILYAGGLGFAAGTTRDGSISRLGAASLAIGNGAAGDYSGTVQALQYATKSGANFGAFLDFSFGLTLPNGNAIRFGAANSNSGDASVSRLAAGSLAIGNGTIGNTTGNLSLNRVNIAGIDFAGTATITAAGTSVTVTYAANYTGAAAPVVVVTPTSDPLAAGIPVGYWVVATGVTTAWTGFTIFLQTALAGNVTFNFIAIGKA
jgi:hypothetical protein